LHLPKMGVARPKTRTLFLTGLALLVALGVVVGGAAGGSKSGSARGGLTRVGPDLYGGKVPYVRPDGKVVDLNIKKKPLRKSARKAMRKALKRSGFSFQNHQPTIGEERVWFALDDTLGFYRKRFTLRGMSNHTEVWVASPVARALPGGTAVGLDFPAGDCRNGVRTTITDAQINYLMTQFDENILPKESVAFSVAPDRDGSHFVPGSAGPPLQDVSADPTGQGDDTVVLLDNVRDDNFYDTNNSQTLTRIAGFFSSGLNELFDRNIMTIDAYDWLHLTGANPPHEPSANPCTTAPARPFLYEGVFAHEYQHLLESYASPGEQSWVNEGLSDWAQTLTGYVKPSTPITTIGFDSHTQCFLGNLGIVTNANPIGRNGGPENSLTLWGDQGDDEILCDYGAAYTMMEYLHGQFGTAFMSALHNQDQNGLAGLDATLGATRPTARTVIHRWAMMAAIDGLLDQGRQLRGGVAARYRTPTLNATINWDIPDAFSEPGAPPNGSDYVQLKGAGGNPLKLNDIQSLSFDGGALLPPHPVEWTVAANPPGQTGDAALYSGTGDLFDRAIVKQVTVPTADPNLRFNAQWNTEDGWDFTFVQVSTDGGRTYKSVRCTDSRPTLAEDPATYPAVANIRVHFPGFTGDSAGWKAETCNLEAYAGDEVLVSFRNMTDPNTQGNGIEIPPGFWLDDVTLGTTLLSDGSTLSGWMSATQARPIPVEGFTVQLVAYKRADTSPVRIATINLNGNFDATLNANQLAGLLGQGNNADVIGAVVMYDESTESINDYAPYALTVNGVKQPGGGM
jgi:hypothetical protein